MLRNILKIFYKFFENAQNQYLIFEKTPSVYNRFLKCPHKRFTEKLPQIWDFKENALTCNRTLENDSN
jgi:hypothetical protein